jgi:hypothetical protein
MPDRGAVIVGRGAIIVSQDAITVGLCRATQQSAHDESTPVQSHRLDGSIRVPTCNRSVGGGSACPTHAEARPFVL